MKCLWSLLLPFALLGCAKEANPVLSRPQSLGMRSQSTSAQLYPLQTGWQWVYRTRQRVDDGPEQPGADHVFRIQHCIEHGDLTEAVMERHYGSFEAPATAIRRTQDEVILSRQEHPEQGSITVLSFPLKKGKSWPGRTWAEATESITFVGEETLTLPAGTFQSAHLEHRIAYQDGRTDRLQYWYAPGVGLVKAIEGLTVDLGQGMQYREVTTELSRYGLAR